MGSRQFVRWAPALGMVVTMVVITNALSSPARTSKSPVFMVADSRIQPKQSHGQGHLGCSAASCHGGGNIGQAGSESLTWFESDPHRKAFEVLHNEQSKIIAKNLAGDKGNYKPAHLDHRCLQCHAPEAITTPKQHLLSPVGVSCESCHGQAGDWETAHYQVGWKDRAPKEQASEYGFYPLKDLNFRVKVCASCHVGDENREVNHDLIAAGHPRLAFEYSAYHNMPKYQKHWKEKDPQFETKAWEAGQIVGAQSAVALLKTRADRAGTESQPWPELSEFACYSCHKDLGSQTLTKSAEPKKSWKEISDSTHRLGGMRWGSWYNATIPWLAEHRGESVRSLGIQNKLNQLTNMVEAPTANPKKVSDLAAEVLKDFDSWAGQSYESAWTPLKPNDLAKGLALHAVDPKTKRLRNMEWDEATQYYLGIAAARFAMRVPTDSNDPLLNLRSSLKFPTVQSNQKVKTGDLIPGVNSPADTNPANVLNAFERLQSQYSPSSPPREQRP